MNPPAWLRQVWLLAGKDLRSELRSRVTVGQVLPFGLTVLLLFAFALDPDSRLLNRATSGLFWCAVVFASVLIVQRSSANEREPGVADSLLLSGAAPSAVFVGKAVAVIAQLAVLELVLAVGVVLLYGFQLHSPGVLALAAGAGTVGVAAAGGIYGLLSGGLQIRETLLPLLLLPVLAPVLLAATRAWEAALGRGIGSPWPWIALEGVFAVSYAGLGCLVARPLLEDP